MGPKVPGSLNWRVEPFGTPFDFRLEVEGEEESVGQATEVLPGNRRGEEDEVHANPGFLSPAHPSQPGNSHLRVEPRDPEKSTT